MRLRPDSRSETRHGHWHAAVGGRVVSELATRANGSELLERAGSGFRDFTRIAASSAEMWRDIALANRDALLAEIDRYGDALRNLRQLIEANDGAGLEDLFARAATARVWLDAAPEGDGG